MTNEDYILRAIGNATVSFSALEEVMAETIREFITNDYELAKCITARLGTIELLTLLSTLFRYRISKKATLEKFGKLAHRIKTLNEDRNAIIHERTFIFSDMALRKRISKTIKDGLKVETKHFELSDILDFISRIDNAIWDIQEIMDENREIIKKHRRKTVGRTARKIMLESLKTQKDNVL